MINGFLVGFTIYNFDHATNPPQLWTDENYSEVKVSQILTNFALTMRTFPNVLSLELLA